MHGLLEEFRNGGFPNLFIVLLHEMRLDDAMGGQGQMTRYAADWSIDPRAKLLDRAAP